MVALYLVLALHMMAVADVRHIRRRARLQDEGQYAILSLTATAALASLGAIVAILGMSGASERQPIHLLLGILTILLSWSFTHIMFALHYAHNSTTRMAAAAAACCFRATSRSLTTGTFSIFRSSSG
jgi:uncharacterized membrane protein